MAASGPTDGATFLLYMKKKKGGLRGAGAKMPRDGRSLRSTEASAVAACDASSIMALGPDLLMMIVHQHALVHTRGWTSELWTLAHVSSGWRDAVLAVRPVLEEWTALCALRTPARVACPPRVGPTPSPRALTARRVRRSRWRIPKYPELARNRQVDRHESSTFWCGAHGWRLLLCPNHAGALGLFLAVADGDGRILEEGVNAQPPGWPSGWSRTVQFELQVMSPPPRQLAPDGQRAVILTWAQREVVFSDSRRTWGHPRLCETPPLHEEDPAHALIDAGWLSSDGALEVTCHVRARDGRKLCPDAGPSHRLALADPNRVYSRYNGAWHCDICGFAGARGAPMHHCTQNCEYDLCDTCFQQRARTASLRPRGRPLVPRSTPPGRGKRKLDGPADG